MRKGLTLIELMITTVMIVILTAVTVYIFRAILLSWSGGETRAGIDIGLDRGIEEMVRDLREAKAITSVNNDEIRFTTASGTYCIYYLYDTKLRKTELNGVTNEDLTTGTFTNGDGRIIISDVLPYTDPTSPSVLSKSGNIVTINLSVKRKDETINSKAQVRPRNFCGSDLVVTHTPTDTVSPVTENTVITYGTLLSTLGGTGAKCWITQNLGADHQATSATDATEPSAGWYWQFNRKQGYYQPGENGALISTATPSTWDSSSDNTACSPVVSGTEWCPINDPCTLLLGEDWRLPTNTEWTNADGAPEYWDNRDYTYASVLKLHAAGSLYCDTGTLSLRGGSGAYWSSTKATSANPYNLLFSNSSSGVSATSGAYGFSVRCLKDLE